MHCLIDLLELRIIKMSSAPTQLLWIIIAGLTSVIIYPGITGVNSVEDPLLLEGKDWYKTCREQNVTFSWETPENLTEVFYTDLYFIPRDPNVNISKRQTIISIKADGSVKVNTRYKGRLTKLPSVDTYSFKLENVNTNDRGQYEIKVYVRPPPIHVGTALLTVYAEDNLWPIEDPEAQTRQEQSETEARTYRYAFIKPDESPSVGIQMSVKLHDIKEACYFGNTSKCEIIFTMERLEGLSGTVRFDVKPLFEDGVVLCQAIKMPYDYKISIVRAKLSNALVGGICLSVFVAAAACIIPPVVLHVKKKNEKFLPLKGGYDFLKGCIDRIEESQDISDVYRKNANSKTIHPHVKAYFQDPKSRKAFFEDEGLTKIYFAAFIKHYISNVREPLLSLEYIHRIKYGEAEFDVATLEEALAVKKKDPRKTKTKKRILRILFQHFSWFRHRKIQADGSDDAENSPSKILTTTGLSGLLSMNFDRATGKVDLEEFNRMARLTRFLRDLIIHCDQIFGLRDDCNGDITTIGDSCGDITQDMSHRLLLDANKDQNITCTFLLEDDDSTIAPSGAPSKPCNGGGDLTIDVDTESFSSGAPRDV